MERYFLTAENLERFIEQFRSLVGSGTYTYIRTGITPYTGCRISELSAQFGGLFFCGASHDGRVHGFEVAPESLAGKELHPPPTASGRTVHVTFRDNTLVVLGYDPAKDESINHIFVANREPEVANR